MKCATDPGLAGCHLQLARSLTIQRPVLGAIADGQEKLEVALDAERRHLMHANEKRLEAYMRAAERWAAVWPETSQAMEGLALDDIHEMMVSRAEADLPFVLEESP